MNKGAKVKSALRRSVTLQFWTCGDVAVDRMQVIITILSDSEFHFSGTYTSVVFWMGNGWKEEAEKVAKVQMSEISSPPPAGGYEPLDESASNITT